MYHFTKMPIDSLQLLFCFKQCEGKRNTRYCFRDLYKIYNTAHKYKHSRIPYFIPDMFFLSCSLSNFDCLWKIIVPSGIYRFSSSLSHLSLCVHTYTSRMLVYFNLYIILSIYWGGCKNQWRKTIVKFNPNENTLFFV